MFKNIFLLIICISCFTTAKTQTTENSFKVTTKTFKQNNKVYIRWVLQNTKQWRLANNYGYNIERAELGSTNYQLLNATPIKAISIQTALRFGKNSTIYDCVSMVNQLETETKKQSDDDLIYAFYLLLSSNNFSNATYSASGFLDTTIHPQKEYTYRVSVAGINIQNQTLINSSVGLSNTSMSNMPEIKANFADKKATVTWDIKNVIDEYPSVIVERSLDSVVFLNITTKPLISSLQQSADNKNDTLTKIMKHEDEEVSNNTKYYYRIRGINIFGLYSNASNIVSGECIPDFKSVPKIILIDTLASKFTITWFVADSLKALVKKYELYASETPSDSTYRKIIDLIPQKAKENFQFAFNYKPKEINYFVVKAILKKDNAAVISQPYFYQLKDSTPPAIPTNLQAGIDFEGNVVISWKKNKEDDFKGYKVYKSQTNIAEKSFTAINGEPIEEAIFKEKVILKQLNRNIYYRITALDNKYNESKLSEFILVKRPDVIPPSSPIIKKVAFQTNNKTVQITWAKSFSKDVSNYNIYRKKHTDTADANWQLIATTNNTDTSFTDNGIETYTSYNYKMQSVDSSNLKSNFSTTVTIYAPQKPEKIKTITNLNSYVSRDKKYIELNWNVPNNDILEIIIYRVENRNEEQIVLLVTLPASTKIYDDENIKENTLYTYYLKPVFKNGKSADFVKIDVEY